MRAAMNFRGKTRIAIVAAGVLLLAILLNGRFDADTVDAGTSRAASVDEAPAANGMASTLATTTADTESDADRTSNMPVDEVAPVASNLALENDAGWDPQPTVTVATPTAVSTAAPTPDTRRTGVAAECWGLRGSAPSDFVVTLDREVRTNGKGSALISSRRDTAGYATMFQTSAATPVRGKRVEFSADIRTRGATGGANLLLRAEDARGRTVAFDNMVSSYIGDQRPYQFGNRGITGDSEWSTHHVVVDIPDEARVITYGLSMFGAGKAWIDNARLEVVSNEVATTAPDIRQSPAPLSVMPINPASLTRSPRNLDFDLEAQAGTAPCN
jgi:hypothetical protein